MDLSSRFHKVSAEVYHAVDDLVTFSQDDVRELKAQAVMTPRHRARLCAHGDPEAALQEMLIVHPRDAYIRPHMHLGKVESLMVVEGQVLVIFFDRSGNPAASFDLATPLSSYPFFLRIPEETFHTLLIKSEWLTFLEVTLGPFNRAGTVMAPWSPEENDTLAVHRYREQLLEQASSRLSQGG